MPLASISHEEGQRIREALRKHQQEDSSIRQNAPLPNQQHGPTVFKLQSKLVPPADAPE